MSDSREPINSTLDEWRNVLWPACAYIGGLECVAHAFGRHLGPEISAQVAEFVGKAEPGARLTLQKSKDGFTLQITSAVIRDGQTDDVQLTRLANMSQAMNGVAAEISASRGHEEGPGEPLAPNGHNRST
jgi:hypothetical protein